MSKRSFSHAFGEDLFTVELRARRMRAETIAAGLRAVWRLATRLLASRGAPARA